MLIVVCAALTRPDGRIFVQQRPDASSFGGCWEFPGGKVEPGETPERALVRELAEELAVTVDEAHLTPVGFATATTGTGSLLLLLYGCQNWSGQPRLLQATALDWLGPVAMRALRMPPADRPLVEMLVRARLR